MQYRRAVRAEDWILLCLAPPRLGERVTPAFDLRARDVTQNGVRADLHSNGEQQMKTRAQMIPDYIRFARFGAGCG